MGIDGRPITGSKKGLNGSKNRSSSSKASMSARSRGSPRQHWGRMDSHSVG